MRQTGKSKPVCVTLAGLSGVDTKSQIPSTRRLFIFYLGMSVHLDNNSLPETASYYVRVTLVQI